MAGFGRFKLTDALPEQPAQCEESQTGGPGQGSAPVRKGKGKGKSKSTSKSASGTTGEVRESCAGRRIYLTLDVAISKRRRTARRDQMK